MVILSAFDVSRMRDFCWRKSVFSFVSIYFVVFYHIYVVYLAKFSHKAYRINIFDIFVSRGDAEEMHYFYLIIFLTCQRYTTSWMLEYTVAVYIYHIRYLAGFLGAWYKTVVPTSKFLRGFRCTRIYQYEYKLKYMCCLKGSFGAF